MRYLGDELHAFPIGRSIILTRKATSTITAVDLVPPSAPIFAQRVKLISRISVIVLLYDLPSCTFPSLPSYPGSSNEYLPDPGVNGIETLKK